MREETMNKRVDVKPHYREPDPGENPEQRVYLEAEGAYYTVTRALVDHGLGEHPVYKALERVLWERVVARGAAS